MIRSRDRHFSSFRKHSGGHLEYLKLPKGESSTPTRIFSPRRYRWKISREKSLSEKLRLGYIRVGTSTCTACHVPTTHTPDWAVILEKPPSKLMKYYDLMYVYSINGKVIVFAFIICSVLPGAIRMSMKLLWFTAIGLPIYVKTTGAWEIKLGPFCMLTKDCRLIRGDFMAKTNFLSSYFARKCQVSLNG